MAAAFSAVLREYGIAEPANTIQSLMKVSAGYAKQYYKKLYSLEDSFFDRYKTVKRSHEIDRAKPFDGVAEICRRICGHGGSNYLFTHRGESAQYFIDRFGLAQYFIELVTSKYNFERKPSPEGILYLAAKYGFQRDKALMVGDRDLDILSAKSAGISGCYITDGKVPLEAADICVDRPADLFRVLGLGPVQ